MLKLRQFVGRNRDVAKRAESGGDSVYRSSYVLHFAVKIAPASDDRLHSFFADFNFFFSADDLADSVYCEVLIGYSVHIVWLL